ncbi:hypothetical protein EWM64_g4603 [Hericium alpestre]|uniref:tRNA (guanine(26)-N(2))-dimethyltransferase n=1 Tax=Hericium alpestre TaxID=135208 RepID=A0A4Z0A112_9AGAM|nr:hypothetical protein EWM64_g4603 [Hericium alpestre]
MAEAPPAITVPEGFTLHTENTSHILLPATNEAFLNPVQEFNRDLSVAAIRVWSEELNREKEGKWRKALERKTKQTSGSARPSDKKRRKLEDGSKAPLVAEGETGAVSSEAVPEASETPEVPAESSAVSEKSQAKGGEYRPYKFVLLEALSATGLRSIRYAKEIPLVKYVIANDLSASATAAMKRNVDLNGLGTSDSDAALEAAASAEKPESHKSKPAKVRLNEGDARSLMYAHSLERNRVDVVDLDPYGTAAPFIDAAVQCINDGGLLCVTCTDLSVLATNNYPEKCYSNYGGVPVKAEYCHETALRLVLHTISTSAARYGRFIQPMLSLSIDFYVRLFVKVQSAPIKVKEAASQTSVYYVCSTCQSFYGQSFGKKIEKVNERSGNVNVLFKTQMGPPVSEKCPECESAMHLAGPMWAGPIHDHSFTAKLLEHVEANESKYGTSTRMKGMLTVANEELDVPFYFTPSRVASYFHCTCPPLDDVA